MAKYTIHSIQVLADDRLSENEVHQLVMNEFREWSKQQGPAKILGRVEIVPVPENPEEEVYVRCFERSPIRRVRRITGYLSEQDNFNAAKLSELNDRQPHGR